MKGYKIRGKESEKIFYPKRLFRQSHMHGGVEAKYNLRQLIFILKFRGDAIMTLRALL